MRFAFTLISLALFFNTAMAGKISGLVTDREGNGLPYASIIVKGTGRGTTANNEGRFFLQLDPGDYIIICQYVGYERQERRISVGSKDEVINFELSLQLTSMKEVVVKPGGEDPAYEIIRNAIKKRNYHLNQIQQFQCEVYIKGLLCLRGYPKTLFGKEIDFEDADTAQNKILYLGESVATYSVQKPGKSKIEVISTKVSGESDAFGLSHPQIISFYENNISIGRNLNARGFVSPIADNALNFYKYKLDGVFIEDGKEVNRILVTPKRKYEPLFRGVINITENDWRIHSLKLQLTKESQMDIIDTLTLDQLFVPLNDSVWVIQSQVIYPAINMFGINVGGSYLNIYYNFNLFPQFGKKFFNNTVLKYGDSSNRRTSLYWDSVRRVPLEIDEIRDYSRKDSAERIRKSAAYLDSVDRKNNRFNLGQMLVAGQTFTKKKKRTSYSVASLVNAVNFNTAEGVVVDLSGTYTRQLDSIGTSRRDIFITPNVRYGFTNHHLNAALSAGYLYNKKYSGSVIVSGGKKVFQFNNEDPVKPIFNTFSTLLLLQNPMKTYEAWFSRLQFIKGLGEGFSVMASLEYQDRTPLDNSYFYKLGPSNKTAFTPNYPVELAHSNIIRHQALITTLALRWQPGTRYIELPGRKINIGSRYPKFQLFYTRGIKGLLSSDVEYDKWRFTISDNFRMKLAGDLHYKFSAGGFLNRKHVEVPDYQHFNGNQFIFASKYVGSFQLAPYYLNSTTSSFYTTLNLEYHLNGLLTNKIPLIKKLNWQLVTGSNAFYVNSNNNYLEVFAGLENILKIFRIDFVQSFSKGRKPQSGVVLGIHGALFGN